ncbi:MAG: fibrobacter succinogenes major paralogous domain-containing protein, partial [Flavobacteriales bacterium]
NVVSGNGDVVSIGTVIGANYAALVPDNLCPGCSATDSIHVTVDFNCIYCGEGTEWDEDTQQCLVVDSGPTPSCGEGTVWDPVAEECIVAIPTDTDFDGCVTAGDVLNLLATFGTCPPIPEWPDADLDVACMTWSCGDPLVYQGDTYATVLIGGQCWFAENLRADTFRNGENIPVATPDNPLHTMGMSARVAYAYDNARVDSLGWLYNGFVAIDDRGACPAGWSVPTDEEFKDLERHLGMPEDEVQGTSFRGSDEAFALKSSSVDEPGWNGTNTTGFSAIPSGVHYDSFSGVESSVQFWCRDGLGFNSDNYYRTFTAGGRIYRSTHNISDGHTIRCLKD